MKLSVLKSTFSYFHCLCLLKFSPSPMFTTIGLLWLLLTSRHSLLLTDFIHGLLIRLFLSADETSLGTTRHFLSIYLPHLLQLIPSSYWTLACLAVLSLTIAWCGFCSSDQRLASTFLQIPLALIIICVMNRTPLVLAISFPLLGQIGDFHPLATCAARHTKKHLGFS